MFLAEQTALIIEDRFAGVNHLATALALDHRVDERLQFLARSAFHPESTHRIRVHEPDLGGNSSRQAGFEDGLRFRQSVRANDSGDMQTDLGIAKVIELRQNRLERFLGNRTGSHAIDTDLHDL